MLNLSHYNPYGHRNLGKSCGRLAYASSQIRSEDNQQLLDLLATKVNSLERLLTI
jgi:hypothetical protein